MMTAIILADQQQARHAERMRDMGFRIGRSEGGMHEADRPAVVDGDDQALVVEIRLGQHELLEQVGRHRLHQPSLRRLTAPDFGEFRRVAVAERAV
jgi:hypothetical protein